MSLKQRIVLLLFLLITPLLLILSVQKKTLTYEGQTMGTTFYIKMDVPIWTTKQIITNKINRQLTEFNGIFSTWDDQSEISNFNQSNLDPLPLSDHFSTLLDLSFELYDTSAGAFDITVKPVLDSWGFNHSNQYFVIPSTERIDMVRPYIGMDKLDFNKQTLQKLDPRVTIDMSAIAKGYCVDLVAKILEEHGSNQYMIEIGGEVRVAMPENKNKFWKIGIERPDYYKLEHDLFDILYLKNESIATSGDYQNFFIKEDIVYSHIFDPRTLSPIESNITSVTVIAPTTVMADGLSTTVMVLGRDRGIALVEALQDIECLIIERDEQDNLKSYYSSNFLSYTR